MNNNGPIGIIGAMECEIEYLTGVLEDKKTESVYGYDFYTGRLKGKDVVIMKCGIGKVNAARGTQLLADRYAPCAVINTGIAGGVGPDMEIGDAVISTGLVQHDFDVSPLGYVKGYMFLGEPDKYTVYPADETVADKLFEAANAVMPANTVKRGTIASGDQFIASAEKRNEIYGSFGAIAAEMEGAAVAQTAFFAGIPFAVLRVMSDKGDGTASGNYAEFEKKTAALSAAVIERFAEIF